MATLRQVPKTLLQSNQLKESIRLVYGVTLKEAGKKLEEVMHTPL